MKVFLATVIALTPVSAFANEYQKGYSLTLGHVRGQSTKKSMYLVQWIVLVM